MLLASRGSRSGSSILRPQQAPYTCRKNGAKAVAKPSQGARQQTVKVFARLYVGELHWIVSLARVAERTFGRGCEASACGELHQRNR